MANSAADRARRRIEALEAVSAKLNLGLRAGQVVLVADLEDVMRKVEELNALVAALAASVKRG